MSELFDKDAESNFLCCVFLKSDILAETILKPDDFADYRYGITFKVMKGLYERDVDINTTTVYQGLARAKISEAGQMIGYILGKMPHSNTWRDIQDVILEYSKRRKVLVFCENLAVDIRNIQNELKPMLGQYSERFSNTIRDDTVEQGFASVSDTIFDALDNMIVPDNSGIHTGFESIDRLIGRGMRPGDVVVLAARPSMGKTALALNIADNVARKTNEDVLFYSLETTAQTVTQRLLLSRACVSRDMIENNTGDTEEMHRVFSVADKMRDASVGQVQISDKSGVTVEDMLLEARKFQLRNKDRKVAMIVIDHLQLVRSNNRYGRTQEITEISGKLKGFAKSMNCPILVLSQLSRASESRQDHVPVMSDLRESGSIEQDADIIMMLYRKAYYSKDPKDCSADVYITKNREGEVGLARLMFFGQFMKFQTAPKEWEMMDNMGEVVGESEVPK